MDKREKIVQKNRTEDELMHQSQYNPLPKAKFPSIHKINCYIYLLFFKINAIYIIINVQEKWQFCEGTHSCLKL